MADNEQVFSSQTTDIQFFLNTQLAQKLLQSIEFPLEMHFLENDQAASAESAHVDSAGMEDESEDPPTIMPEQEPEEKTAIWGDFSVTIPQDMPGEDNEERLDTADLEDTIAGISEDRSDLDLVVVGDDAGYITEGLQGSYVQIIDDQPVALQLPQHVTLDVVDTPPELKGGTATKRPKPARLSTGIEIMVPEYIVNGERVLVNTTTGEFGGRAD